MGYLVRSRCSITALSRVLDHGGVFQAYGEYKEKEENKLLEVPICGIEQN